MKATRRHAAGLAAVVVTAAGLLAATGLGAGAAGASSFPAFVGPLHHVTTLASTVPANGDVNPYGVAVVPRGTGQLRRGNILVSNFNNKANVQGTGTTIVQITPIGSGFAEHLDPAALVIGPTGVGLSRNGTPYVADTVANRIAAIPHAVFRVSSAGRGFTVSRGGALNGPLGLVVAPGGDIRTVNSGNGNLVEVTPFGLQVAVRALDVSGSPPGAGALFGLAVKPNHRAVYFVDDATNTFELLH